MEKQSARPRATRPREDGKVFVYNQTTRRIGFYVKDSRSPRPSEDRRPPRAVHFLPGNNEVWKEDLEECAKNPMFRVMTEEVDTRYKSGKLSSRVIPLVIGKRDKKQGTEERRLEKRIEEERRKAASE